MWLKLGTFCDVLFRLMHVTVRIRWQGNACLSGCLFRITGMVDGFIIVRGTGVCINKTGRFTAFTLTRVIMVRQVIISIYHLLLLNFEFSLSINIFI